MLKLIDALLQHYRHVNIQKPLLGKLVSVQCVMELLKEFHAQTRSRYNTVDVKNIIIVLNYLPPFIYMTIYKSTILQSVNIKTLKSSNRSNKLIY